jgi:hypothetical protein
MTCEFGKVECPECGELVDFHANVSGQLSDESVKALQEIVLTVHRREHKKDAQ